MNLTTNPAHATTGIMHYFNIDGVGSDYVCEYDCFGNGTETAFTSLYTADSSEQAACMYTVPDVHVAWLECRNNRSSASTTYVIYVQHAIEGG